MLKDVFHNLIDFLNKYAILNLSQRIAVMRSENLFYSYPPKGGVCEYVE